MQHTETQIMAAKTIIEMQYSKKAAEDIERFAKSRNIDFIDAVVLLSNAVKEKKI